MEGNANCDPLLGDLDEAALLGVNDESPAEASKSSAQANRLAELAVNLRDNAAAGWLYWVMNSTLGEQISPDAFLVYRDVMLKEAGDPKDPIERMLIEQLALAHFSIGQLRIRSCSTDLPKMTLAFSDAATRLLGEFRRCVLALEEYRGKRATQTEKRNSTDGTVSHVPAKVNGHARPSANGHGKHRDTELVSNGKQKHCATKQNGTMHGDVPEWLKNRLAYPTPIESPLADGTAANGKG